MGLHLVVMATWTPMDQQYIQIMIWCLQLLLQYAPAIDPAWAQHWTFVLSGHHFAGEYWHAPNPANGIGMTTWWADLIDTLLDFILPWRADH